jgi:hypothetical protein
MREHGGAPGGATVRRLAAPLLWAVAAPAGAQELAAHWEADATWRYAVIQFTRAVPLGGPHELLAGIGGTQLSYHFSDADGRARLRSTGAALSLASKPPTARSRRREPSNGGRAPGRPPSGSRKARSSRA